MSDPSIFTPDLAGIPFENPAAAMRLLQEMASRQGLICQFQAVFPHLSKILTEAANPDGVIIYLDRFLNASSQLPDLFCLFSDNPRSLEILAILFASSQFLAEILLRNPEYFEQIVDHKRFAQPESGMELYKAARLAMEPYQDFAGQLDALRRFQRLQLLRIGVCDLLDLFDLAAATEQLSTLADTLTQICLKIASQRTGVPENGFAVLGMGKLGGGELNYSSDIDLIFVSNRDGVEYRRLGERLVDNLTRITAEGFLYRVDLRLRPWGKDGPLVTSLSGYLDYLHQYARQWEKQALLKARCIAGDGEVAQAFLQQAEPLLFETNSDPADSVSNVRRNVHAMKQRTEAYLHEQGRDWGEVKLGQGSIRDVEFVAQFLQLIHGARHPGVLGANTLVALNQLHTHGFLPADDHRILNDGYIFLRTIEHHLQVMHYQQTHTLPAHPKALLFLAQRLGYRGKDADKVFLARYEQYVQAIRSVYLHYIGEQDSLSVRENNPIEHRGDELLPQHLARLDASYQAIFTAEEMRHHALLADSLDNEHLVRIEAQPQPGNDWKVTIVAFDYLGELSVICGLLYVYGMDIQRGEVFTYEPLSEPEGTLSQARQKIVDVFYVHPLDKHFQPESWDSYLVDLSELLKLMSSGERRKARIELAKRVALRLSENPRLYVREVDPSPSKSLYPIDIEIDNSLSARYTVLQIDSQDTPGFFYELTNALAFYRIYISRVAVGSVKRRVKDTLYVTDFSGNKILATERQRELRTAIVLIKHFTHLLPNAPDPEAALLHFREFIEGLFQRPNWVDELASLERPEVLNALARLLGVSDFLWDDLLRMQHANLFPVVQNLEGLAQPRSKADLAQELDRTLALVTQLITIDWREHLNTFKDRELFRIDMRHILGFTRDFKDFAIELTDLVEVVIDKAYQRCHAELVDLYGAPLDSEGTLVPLSICALGKCGGRELGFASDIELIFIYDGSGWTSHAKQIMVPEFYEKLVENFLQTIRAPRQGIFEIDLQLRPYGKTGSLAVSLAAFQRYYAPDGPAWAYERQALVRLRPVAGDVALGERIRNLCDELLYRGERFDVTAMRAMRERQVRHLVEGGSFNVKYSPGGLLDVEYLVQALQINYGHLQPSVRLNNTSQAMDALAACGVLDGEDHARLNRAYIFLRRLIDGLRVVRGHAKDLTMPPLESDAFAYLARRLDYGRQTLRLRDDLKIHTSAVQQINYRLLG